MHDRQDADLAELELAYRARRDACAAMRWPSRSTPSVTSRLALGTTAIENCSQVVDRLAVDGDDAIAGLQARLRRRRSLRSTEPMTTGC